MLEKGTPVHFYHDGEQMNATVDRYDESRDVYVVRLANGTVASVSSEYLHEGHVDEDGDGIPTGSEDHHDHHDSHVGETSHQDTSHGSEPGGIKERIRKYAKPAAYVVALAVIAALVAFSNGIKKPEPEKPKSPIEILSQDISRMEGEKGIELAEQAVLKTRLGESYRKVTSLDAGIEVAKAKRVELANPKESGIEVKKAK